MEEPKKKPQFVVPSTTSSRRHGSPRYYYYYYVLVVVFLLLLLLIFAAAFLLFDWNNHHHRHHHSSSVWSLLLWWHDDDSPGGGGSSVPQHVQTLSTVSSKRKKSPSRIQLLHMGNSIQYFNDAPYVLHQMLQDSQLFDTISDTTPNTITRINHQVCLRGGANLVTLYEKGTTWYRRAIGADYGVSSVLELFHSSSSENTNFDYRFAILNDYTQAPARNDTRQESLRELQQKYLPLFLGQQRQQQQQQYQYPPASIPILIETAAYRKDYAYGTKDIGNFDQFTKALQEGYQTYRDHLNDWILMTSNTGTANNATATAAASAYIAPMGTGYKVMRQTNVTAWQNLYNDDNKHPSPQGTLLQAYLLYMTIVNIITHPTTTAPTTTTTPPPQPPLYNPKWFHKYYPYVEPLGTPPTAQEAKDILNVANQVFSTTILQ